MRNPYNVAFAVALMAAALMVAVNWSDHGWQPQVWAQPKIEGTR